jgi:hypothetical protein
MVLEYAYPNDEVDYAFPKIQFLLTSHQAEKDRLGILPAPHSSKVTSR